MYLRKFQLKDYEEVVDMYYQFITEIFSEKRKISPKYFYYQKVSDWINSKKNIIIAEKNKVIVGFSMSFIDEFDGLTEPIYNGETIYVKPEFRKTRAGYMLYHNTVKYSEEIGLNIMANGRVENKIDKMIEKHFKPTTMFINYERKYNG